MRRMCASARGGKRDGENVVNMYVRRTYACNGYCYFLLLLCIIMFIFRAVMTDNAFKARDVGLRAQKKILSRMATKTVAKTFIDGTTASLLDNIYRLAKLHVSTTLTLIHPIRFTFLRVPSNAPTVNCRFLIADFSSASDFHFICQQSGNKKDAERLVKNIIKIVIKIGLLYRNNQFNADELKTIERFRNKFQVITN